MKKQFLILVAGLFMTLGVTAQTNNDKSIDSKVKQYIEKVQEKVELTEAEKEKLYELRKEQMENFMEVTKEYKGTPDLRKERQKVGNMYKNKLKKSFGEEKGKEIIAATAKKK